MKRHLRGCGADLGLPCHCGIRGLWRLAWPQVRLWWHNGPVHLVVDLIGWRATDGSVRDRMADDIDARGDRWCAP